MSSPEEHISFAIEDIHNDHVGINRNKISIKCLFTERAVLSLLMIITLYNKRVFHEVGKATMTRG